MNENKYNDKLMKTQGLIIFIKIIYYLDRENESTVISDRISRFKRKEEKKIYLAAKYAKINISKDREMNFDIDNSNSSSDSLNCVKLDDENDRICAFEEKDYIQEIDQFLCRFYEKNYSFDENFVNGFKAKIDFVTNNQVLSKKFVKCFCDKNLFIINNQLRDNIINNQIYKDLKEKFCEMKYYFLTENVKNINWDKRITEFYKSNKSNINLIFMKLIDFYENLSKKWKILESALKDQLSYDQNEKIKIEYIQKNEFAELIIKEELINDVINEVFEKNGQEIPKIIKEKIKFIKEELNKIKFDEYIENNIIADDYKEEIKSDGVEDEETNENISMDNEEIYNKKLVNMLNRPFNLEEILEYIMKDESTSKKTKQKKNLNKKTNFKPNKAAKLIKKTINLFTNAVDESDKEIEEFRKKLKESSIPAHMSVKIKPNTSQEWNISIQKGLKI